MKSFDSVDNHQLEGSVYVIPTELGGRATGIRSGYRGQFFWHINHEDCSDWLAESYFENDLIEPGQSARIKIRLGGAIKVLGQKSGMPPGSQFALREGSKIVAVGVITKSQFEETNRRSMKSAAATEKND
ncbi:MAG: hypothetical protein AAF585_04255 [Verrucomicrobiota bacterium]